MHGLLIILKELAKDLVLAFLWIAALVIVQFLTEEEFWLPPNWQIDPIRKDILLELKAERFLITVVEEAGVNLSVNHFSILKDHGRSSDGLATCSGGHHSSQSGGPHGSDDDMDALLATESQVVPGAQASSAAQLPVSADCDSDQSLLRDLVPKAIIARAERLRKRNSKKTAKRKRKLLDDLLPWRKQCFYPKCTAKSKDNKLSRRRKRDFLSSSMIGDFSVSDGGIVNRNRLCIEEAKQTWDTMVHAGIDSLGNDSEILNTLAEMNDQDWDRFESKLGP
ncbi:hypothetical protein L1049_020793 [Liquidambar formosana]|uniref:Uncharacterized protein n=1 Tax=Liquidambar formosana TaxID=63359 RepID=A0AAP0SAH3_LIQFO